MIIIIAFGGACSYPFIILEYFFNFLKIICVFSHYFWLHWVFIGVLRLSLVAARGLLIVVASLVAEHRCWAFSVVVAQGLSCRKACGIFPDQGSNLCPLHGQADS